MVKFTFDFPDVNQLKKDYYNPDKYLLNQEIVGAVKAAMTLGQPLFITGEPGTGKTQLAYKIAQHFQLANDEGIYKPLIFNTKTTSTARDLFYTYDAVRHFRDANMKKKSADEVMDYIDLQALGKAIAYTNPKAAAKLGLEIDSPRNSVVLIDEIDKAPTDFANDILFELENLAFEIKETGMQFKVGENHRPVILMTSNSEKSLPDAFLRRCVFLHIEFPDEELLLEIVKSKLSPDSLYSDEVFVKHFIHIRNVVKKKKPATAELIGWLNMLELENFVEEGVDFNHLTEKQKQILRYSYGIIAKNKDDLSIIEREFLQ